MAANATNFTMSPMLTPGLMDRQPHMTRLMLVLYAIIFVVGIFGNALVLYVVIKFKTMQTITNRFIACLSVSDLLLCIFAVPFTPINALGRSWVFGELLCKLVPVVLLISVFVSTLTSVLIALDRYMIIVHPHTSRMSTKTQVISMIAIWVLAASAAVPIGIFTYLVPGSYPNTVDCTENWPNNVSGNVYTWVIMILQLVIPAIIITVCYASVSLQLASRTRNRNNVRDFQKIQQEANRNCRINKMLISMVVIFIMCWLPLDLIHVSSNVVPEEHFLTVFLFLHILAMSSVMYNPFLYGYLNDNFNKHFREIWSRTVECCCQWRHKDINIEKPAPSPKKNLTSQYHTSISLLEMNNSQDPNQQESQPFIQQNNGYSKHLSPDDVTIEDSYSAPP